MPSFRRKNRYQKAWKRTSLCEADRREIRRKPLLEDKGDLFETKLMLTGIAELLGCYIPADFFVTQKIAFRYIGLNFKGKVAI